MKSAHFHSIGALQCRIVVFGSLLAGSAFSLQLVTSGDRRLILVITRDDFVRREEMFLWKKVFLG